ncbi:MAG: pyruvate dehydrogenase complex dihydrolipoamide acetyltransferase [Acidobacteria bacterium]|nr:pyruvate dehydrogenase complex dihydrolipoamide acetyltransferase [Acidobacteriota bacterium]
MATQVVMPKLSPTMEEGQLSRWLKKEGDKVSVGEGLAEIDTDKATMEAQALATGVLRKILVPEGETVPLGAIIAIIGEPDEDISGLVTEASKGAAQAEKKEPVEERQESQPAKSDAPSDYQPGQWMGDTASAEQPTKEAPQAQPQASAGGNGQRGDGRLIVSPIAARMAADAGINLHNLTGSGPGGRIVKRDIEAAMKAGSAAQPQTQSAAQPQEEQARPAPVQQPAVQPAGGAAPYREENVSTMRATIARRLVTSLGPIPHIFLTTEIEMDRTAEMRKQLNALDPENKVSINDFVIKVAAHALMRHPAVNASFQEKTIRYYERADVGVAVALENGLITPVVRAANTKSVGQISREVKELAERARNRKLAPEEYTGATFSVSNLGMFGISEFTALINPPEACILAVGAMTPTPVVRDGEVVVRQLMKVTLSCDHRIVDGATGAQFLQTLKKILENPLYLIA